MIDILGLNRNLACLFQVVLESGMEYRNPNVSMGLPGMREYDIWRTDVEKVRAVRALLV